MGSIGRSFQLVGQSYRILMSDKFGAGAIFRMIFFWALQGVYVASFRFATEGAASTGLDQAFLDRAFVHKGR